MAYVVACDYNFFFVCLLVFWILLTEFLLNDGATTLSAPSAHRGVSVKKLSHPIVCSLKYLTVWNCMYTAYVRLLRILADWFPLFCLKKKWSCTLRMGYGYIGLLDYWSKVSNGYFYCLNRSSCNVQAFIIHIMWISFIRQSPAIDVFTLYMCVFLLIFPIYGIASIYYLV